MAALSDLASALESCRVRDRLVRLGRRSAAARAPQWSPPTVFSDPRETETRQGGGPAEIAGEPAASPGP